MCGRFVQTQEAENYGAYFSVDVVQTDEVLKSWNVAPTKKVYAVAEHDGERLLGTFGWGLVPFWAKDRKIGCTPDQRSSGDRGGEARVSGLIRRAPMHRSCRRLLRVGAEGARQTPALLLCDRSKPARPRRAVGIVGGPGERGSGAHVHHRDWEAVRCGVADPRPDAGDPAENGMGRVA